MYLSGKVPNCRPHTLYVHVVGCVSYFTDIVLRKLYVIPGCLTAKHWQTSGQLEEQLNVCTVAMFHYIINSLIAINADDYLDKLSSRSWVGHGSKYRLLTTNATPYTNSSFPWTVEKWNKLPEIIKAPTYTRSSINVFKEGLVSLNDK